MFSSWNLSGGNKWLDTVALITNYKLFVKENADLKDKGVPLTGLT